MSQVIKIKNLRFSYQNSNQEILNIPNLEFAKNETVFLFGPSGGGKTTLLEILAGVITGQEGDVTVLENNLQKMNSSERDQFRSRHIGYIFQQFNLIPYLTVKENILLPFTFNHKKINPEIYEKITVALGIEKLNDQLASRLSVGQQQRVAAARALVGQPEIILADEPTSALDYDARENFLNILFQLVKSQQSTLVFVSHDRSIQNLFDRKLNLSEVCHA